MPTDTPFARALRDALDARGWSRADLLERLGGAISPRSLDYYCAGREPPLSRAILIGEALGWHELAVLRTRLEAKSGSK